MGSKGKGAASPQCELRRKKGWCSKLSLLSQKKDKMLPLHLVEMYICTPGRKLKKKKKTHSIVRKVISAQ